MILRLCGGRVWLALTLCALALLIMFDTVWGDGCDS